MSTLDDVTAQLADELEQRLHAWFPLLGTTDAFRQMERELSVRVPTLAAQLCQDDDDRLLAQTVIDVLGALWPTSDPDPEWWQTPLGRRCAASLGHEDTEAVTHSIAAAMLGVPRGSIGTLVHRGELDRHPDGGVLRASVFQRLAR